mmetsp:Transcript_65685/g.207845  ORF Transcript_65685/g.207845 Transcript_65685/m.207845 type:complete len:207 (-) Transcript_65685:11-631(-)
MMPHCLLVLEMVRWSLPSLSHAAVTCASSTVTVWSCTGDGRGAERRRQRRKGTSPSGIANSTKKLPTTEWPGATAGPSHVSMVHAPMPLIVVLPSAVPTSPPPTILAARLPPPLPGAEAMISARWALSTRHLTHPGTGADCRVHPSWARLNCRALFLSPLAAMPLSPCGSYPPRAIAALSISPDARPNAVESSPCRDSLQNDQRVA